MPVTEVHQGGGSWNIGLRFPEAVWGNLLEFGHVLFTDRSFSPAGKTDAQFLDASVYTGVMLQRSRSDKGWMISGKGIEYWLGEGVQYGEVLEPPKALNINYFDGANFSTVMNALKPQALTIGAIYTTGLTATYYNEHIWQTPLNAIRYVLEAYGAIHDVDVEYKVDNRGRFYAGQKQYLYVINPTAAIVRRINNTAGPTSFGGKRFVESIDASDYATRTVLQGEGAGYTLLVGDADLTDIGVTNRYKDLHGNPLKRVKVISEPETPQYTDNPNYLPDFRAKVHLKDSQELGNRVVVHGADWDLDQIGSFSVGDMVWVYNDQDSFWKDMSNPITYQGATIYPIKKRVHKKTWPVDTGEHKVFYRNKDGAYTEITQYVINEDKKSASVEVGSAARKLAYNTEVLKNIYLERATHNPDIPPAPNPGGEVDEDGNLTIPAQVQWANRPWGYNTWADQGGVVKIEILVQWTQPNNTNGNPITDGDRYELEHRRSNETQWRPAFIVGWGNTQRLVSGLEVTPASGWNWQFRIRAVDNGGNAGAWSTTEGVTAADVTPPSQPAAPSIVVHPLFFEVIHTGTKNGGGDLEADTKYLNIHISNSSGFIPGAANREGRISLRPGYTTRYFADVSEWGNNTLLYVKVTAEDWVGNVSAVSPSASALTQIITGTVIADGSITTGKLSANSVTASKMQAITIEVGKHIQSTGYATGNPGTGFRISGDGFAEFSGADIRGTLNASDLTAGELNVARIGLNKIGMDKIQLIAPLVANQYLQSTVYSAGYSGWRIQADGNAYFNSITLNSSTLAGTSGLTGWLTTGVGGGFRTRTTGPRVQIRQGAPDRIEFYSGLFGDPAFIQVTDEDLGGNPFLRLASNQFAAAKIEMVGSNLWLSANAGISIVAPSVGIGTLVSIGGSLRVASGTLANPGIQFKADTNLGIYRIAENTLGTAHAGSIGINIGPGVEKYIYGLQTNNLTGALRWSNTTGQIGYQASRRAIKKNIKPLQLTDDFDRLLPVQYDMRDGSGDGLFGFIAEDVEEVYPTLVYWGHETATGPDEPDVGERMIVNYEDRGILALIVAALQDARARIAVLERNGSGDHE